MASESLFCVRWIRNTIRKVMMVVMVLATSCQVSDQWNIGPAMSQTMTNAIARMNAVVEPVQRVDQLANRSSMCGLQGRGRFTRGASYLTVASGAGPPPGTCG